VLAVMHENPNDDNSYWYYVTGYMFVKALDIPPFTATDSYIAEENDNISSHA